MIYFQLFLSFLYIGAFSFGGGYAALPLIEEIIVENNAWLTITEFADLATISQMTPGPIAINSATFIGLRIAGFWGAIAATIGNVLPSLILVSFIAYIYSKYSKLGLLQTVLDTLRPAVVSMIAVAGLSLTMNAFWGPADVIFANINFISVFIFGLSLFLLMKLKKSPIIVMVLAGILNVILTVLSDLI